MSKKRAAPNISFADSELRSYEWSARECNLGNLLIIYFNSWDNKTLKCTFTDPIQFSHLSGDCVEDLYQNLKITPFLEEALSRNYIKVPIDHPYKLFQVEDIDEFPFIQVVAQNVEIIKE